MLLREVVRRPLDYGLDHRHACLTSVLEFSTRNPRCVRDSEASARQKIERCLEGSRSRRSDPRPIERQIRRQLLEVKQDLAWTELDHLLASTVDTGTTSRYARLAKSLCVLAVLWRYRRQRFPQARGVCVKCGSRPPRAAVAIAAARVESAARPFEPKRAGLARGHDRAPGGNEPIIPRRAGRDRQDSVSGPGWKHLDDQIRAGRPDEPRAGVDIHAVERVSGRGSMPIISRLRPARQATLFRSALYQRAAAAAV